MTKSEKLGYIVSSLDEEDFLIQIAEEAAEVAQAAAKYARILRGKNPSPVTVWQIYTMLLEELEDLRIAERMFILKKNSDIDEAHKVMEFLIPDKVNRWYDRLKEKEESHAE